MDPQPHVNPYIAGSPITGTEMFYGREDVFSFIKRNLTGLHRDTPIVLYGQRRTGKTSVLYQLHRHLDPDTGASSSICTASASTAWATSSTELPIR